MPSIGSIKFEKLQWLKENGSYSVVTILRYREDTNELADFGTGFVVHAYNKKAVVIASVALMDKDGGYLVVCYGNGSVSRAAEFVSNFNSRFVSLLVDDTDEYSKPVEINTAAVERGQVIFTIAEGWETIKRAGMFTGCVIHPRCTCVKILSRSPVAEYNNLFAFSCPVGGPVVGEPATFERLIGAPVFNLEGEVVGVTERCSAKSYDMKFARLSTSFLTEMEILFGCSDWKSQVQHLLMRKGLASMAL